MLKDLNFVKEVVVKVNKSPFSVNLSKAFSEYLASETKEFFVAYLHPGTIIYFIISVNAQGSL